MQRKTIDTGDQLLYYLDQVNKGKKERSDMSFKVLKYTVIITAVIMCLAIIVNLVLVHTTSAEFWMADPIKIYLGAILSIAMMSAGYLFRSME